MDYYIGIDSGGTKTESILADDTGHIIAYSITPGCNPLDIGISAACEGVFAVVDKLVGKAPGKVRSIYAGIAGVNRIELGIEDALKAKFGPEVVTIEDDRRIVLSGNLGRVNGCGLICGTGSSLSIFRVGQPTQQIGGLGYLIDTCGSGYELGQAALKKAFRSLDGRDGYTVLPELIERQLGKPLSQGLADIYNGGRTFIASLSGCVFEGLALNDEACINIAVKAADSIAELVNAAKKFFDGPYPVVMTGGIINSHPDYVRMICERVNPDARMIMGSCPPVYGAFVEAMWQCGADTSPQIRRNFIEDYKKMRSEEGFPGTQRGEGYGQNA